MTAALFVLAAAVAAALRLEVGLRLGARWGLLGVNVIGSVILGALVASDASAVTMTVLGTGLCGTLTTYSSFVLEVRALGVRRGSSYAALTLVLVFAGARLGMGW